MDCVRADWSRGYAESLRAGLGCLSPPWGHDLDHQAGAVCRIQRRTTVREHGLEGAITRRPVFDSAGCTCCDAVLLLQATRDRVHSAAVLTCGSIGVEFLRGVYGLIHKVSTWR